MPKAQEYRVPRPLGGADLEEVRRRAREAYPTFRDPFPQEVPFRARYRSGGLPPPGDAPDLSMARRLYANCTLAGAGVTPELVADIVGGLLAVAPEGGPTASLVVEGAIQLPAGEGCPERCQEGRLDAQIRHGGLWFGFGAGGIVTGYPAGEQERRFAAERRYMELVITRVIEAARLPLRIVPAGKSFTVEHTEGGSLDNMFEPKEYGTSFFICSLPDSSPRDLARRLFDALAAVPSTIRPRFSARVGLEDNRDVGSVCPALYNHLQAQRWPAQSWELSTVFRVGSPQALDGLRAFLAGPAAGLRMPLGQFKVDGKRTAKLLVKVRPDGHHLSLHLPADDQASPAACARTLGVSFGE